MVLAHTVPWWVPYLYYAFLAAPVLGVAGFVSLAVQSFAQGRRRSGILWLIPAFALIVLAALFLLLRRRL